MFREESNILEIFSMRTIAQNQLEQLFLGHKTIPLLGISILTPLLEYVVDLSTAVPGLNRDA
jgi:hypothetical protein